MRSWAMRLRRWLAVAGLCTAVPHAGAATLPTGTVQHGPFEIVASVKRISTGTFPNQGGNPFARREVSEFQVRWKGEPVATAGGNRTFWRVLRLPGAPRPALLLVTTGFVLASEDGAGRLQLQPINAESSSLAEVQWLDERGGQPGPTHDYGIEAVTDLEAGTRLEGGRWLRLGSRSVLDVTTLAVHPVEPWVPIVPGVPITSISRDGDTVRAFSPSRGQYVLAASGIDYGSADHRDAYGLLVVDIAAGSATELRVDRKRFRFATLEDIDAAWVDHHFTWQRDGAGREQLRARASFAPWPWRARLELDRPGSRSLNVPCIDGRFLLVVQRLAEAEAGGPATDTSQPWGAGFAITVDGCPLEVRHFDGDSSDFTASRVAVWPATPAAGTAHVPACEPVLRRLAAAIDAELATGRHDALLRLQ